MIADSKDRYKVILAIHLILTDGNKILLGKRQNTGWSDGKYHLFGGHVEQGELATDAVIREGREELGIQISNSDIEFVHARNILRADHSRLHLYFMIKKWVGIPSITEADLCSELNWFDINHLPPETTADTQESLNNIQKKIYYMETKLNE